MRTHGTLIKWNDDRGFGFVTIPQGIEMVFVHISAFPADGTRPRVGELLSFEVRNSPDGRMRAELVERPAARKAMRSSRDRGIAAREHRRSPVGALLVGLAILAAGYAAYREYPDRRDASATLYNLPAARSTSEEFACDGRTHCSQMTSCAEAEYFLQHCPNTKMDGNNDGEPCEQQWCNSH